MRRCSVAVLSRRMRATSRWLSDSGAGHAVLQQRDPFAQRRQRCLQLVRHVAQEARLVGVQPGQALAQPVQPAADLAHVGRAADFDALVEPVLAQLDDRAFHAPQRPCQPQRQRQRQQQGQRQRGDDLAPDRQPAGIEFGLQFGVARHRDAAHLFGHRAVQRVEFAKGQRQPAVTRRGRGRRADQLQFDLAALPAPARDERIFDGVFGQRVDVRRGFGGGAFVGVLQRRVAQHQVLARRALHRQALFAQAFGVAAQAQRAFGAGAAALQQLFQRVLAAQRDAAQQRGLQQEGHQQQLAERGARQGRQTHRPARGAHMPA